VTPHDQSPARSVVADGASASDGTARHVDSPPWARDRLAALLAPAGVQLDGSRPWDIRVNDPGMPQRVLLGGSLGAGESYMDGGWDCDALDDMFTRVLRASIDERLSPSQRVVTRILARLRNPQSRRRALVVGRRHYDIGDDLYRRMLDARMIYSCAYWPRAATLDEAQEHKLDLVCRKLGLQPGMRVLDIGCGWGGAARFAAERYGVSVTGLTISRNQYETAVEYCKGLPVEIRFEDYRSHTPVSHAQSGGAYDRIYSLGMFEHVGESNYRTYFRKARELLAPDGLFLLHTIGVNLANPGTDPWIEKYIFPNSHLPSHAEVARAAERCWVIEDWHNFGPDYDRTLLSWSHNITQHWAEIPAYDERFRRMWHYWLMSSAAAFRARRNQLWQIVLSTIGRLGGYREVR